MKRLLIRLLAALGLVTAGRYQLAVAQLRNAESRVKKLSGLLDESRARVHTCETNVSNAAQRVKSVEKAAAAHREREAEQQKREVARLKVEINRLRKRNEDLDDVQKRLASAEQGLLIAREQLMMVEVKLDILEGAANVLDGRTRAIVAQPVDETSAPV